MAFGDFLGPLPSPLVGLFVMAQAHGFRRVTEPVGEFSFGEYQDPAGTVVMAGRPLPSSGVMPVACHSPVSGVMPAHSPASGTMPVACYSPASGVMPAAHHSALSGVMPAYAPLGAERRSDGLDSLRPLALQPSTQSAPLTSTQPRRASVALTLILVCLTSLAVTFTALMVWMPPPVAARPTNVGSTPRETLTVTSVTAAERALPAPSAPSEANTERASSEAPTRKAKPRPLPVVKRSPPAPSASVVEPKTDEPDLTGRDLLKEGLAD